MAQYAVFVRLPYGDAVRRYYFCIVYKFGHFSERLLISTSSACHILAFVGSIHGRALECFVIYLVSKKGVNDILLSNSPCV